MKKFYFLTLSVVLFNISFSAPVITASSNGNWNLTATWNLNRLPQSGDTVVISSGITVAVTDDQYLNSAVLKIYGKLTFQNNNSTLNLTNSSAIWVFDGGQITGGGSASQKLKLNGTGIFQGDNAPVNGPEMASASTNGFAPFASSPLPVKFIGFTVTSQNTNALIQWSTSEEINANTYQVERSENGVSWTTIAYVSAAGNSSVVNNYSYTDKNISAKVVYYRVKEVDFDGKTSLTAIKSVKANVTYSNADIKIASIQNKVLLQFSKEIKGSVTVRFVSMNGQLADQQTINNPLGQIVVNSKVTGHYIISISNGQDISTATQVIL